MGPSALVAPLNPTGIFEFFQAAGAHAENLGKDLPWQTDRTRET